MSEVASAPPRVIGPTAMGIDVAGTFRVRGSLDLQKVRDDGMILGRAGRKIGVGQLRNFAKATIGCRPLGKNGPILVLPTLVWSGEYRTMPAWVDTFERWRAAIAAGLEGPA